MQKYASLANTINYDDILGAKSIDVLYSTSIYNKTHGAIESKILSENKLD